MQEIVALVDAMIGLHFARRNRANRREQIVFLLIGIVTSIPMQILANWVA
jgi:hypothetical protein